MLFAKVRIRVYADNLQMDMLEEYWLDHPYTIDDVIAKTTDKYSFWEIITIGSLYIRKLES
jgi:hypothetical protein